ncbi:tripartite tricarboxylate transporter TctB family protein [Paracandidimonas soli]|uniref:tripartite tricarboxylate transporter TctB family protein n=1 Tax=Paracandidimonas soli TaxID=1917182 RepID=UPI00333E6871
MKKIDSMDVIGGALFCILGISVFFYSQSEYELGSLAEMGPGAFPAYLGVIMTLLGAGITIEALYKRHQRRSLNIGPMIAVVAGIVAFALTIERLGALAAIFALVFISAWPDRNLNFRRTLILAVALVVIACVVFKLGLSMNFSLVPGVL